MAIKIPSKFDLIKVYEDLEKKYTSEEHSLYDFWDQLCYNYTNSVYYLSKKTGYIETNLERPEFYQRLQWIFDHHTKLNAPTFLGKMDENTALGTHKEKVWSFISQKKTISGHDDTTMEELGFGRAELGRIFSLIVAFWNWAFSTLTPPPIQNILKELESEYNISQESFEKWHPRQKWKGGDAPAPTKEQMDTIFKADETQLTTVLDQRYQVVFCVDSSIRMNSSLLTENEEEISLLENIIRSIGQFYQMVSDGPDSTNLRDSLELFVCSFGGKSPCKIVEFANLTAQKPFFDSLRTQLNHGKGKGATCLGQAISLAHRELDARMALMEDKDIQVPYPPNFIIITDGLFRENVANEAQYLLGRHQAEDYRVSCLVIGPDTDGLGVMRMKDFTPKVEHVNNNLEQYLCSKLFDELKEQTMTEGGTFRRNSDSLTR